MAAARASSPLPLSTTRPCTTAARNLLHHLRQRTVLHIILLGFEHLLYVYACWGKLEIHFVRPEIYAIVFLRFILFLYYLLCR